MAYLRSLPKPLKRIKKCRKPLDNPLKGTAGRGKNFFKKILDFLPGLWYYNTRKRKNPTNRKENLKMTFEYYEIHATEWEAAQAFWAEEEDLAQMDADWEASGGHLWD